MVRMAEENRDWGYRRIEGALSNLGHEIARSTIAQILERHGIEPAPERSRKTTWKEFLSRHWELIVATDFFTGEVWTGRGLQRFIILFFIDLSTRKVEIAGIAQVANGLWMNQIARNLTDAEQGILTGKRYLIHDRDPLFTAEFLDMIADAGVESVKLPPRSPNLNAYAERFVRSIKESCLDRMIFFGEESLRTAIQNFVAHYHSECQRRLNIPQFPPVEKSPLRRLKFPQAHEDCRHAPAQQASAWMFRGRVSIISFPSFRLLAGICRPAFDPSTSFPVGSLCSACVSSSLLPPTFRRFHPQGRRSSAGC